MEEMVFIRLSDTVQPDLPIALRDLAKDHTFVSGFDIEVNVPIEIVIENGFDQAHFKGVHGLLEEPNLHVGVGELEELTVKGLFKIPRTSWNKPNASNEPVTTEYSGRTFSPGTIIVNLRGEDPYNYYIITSAIPLPGSNKCTVRLNLALPHKVAENKTFISALLEASMIGLQRDIAVWNHLAPDFQEHLTESDKAVITSMNFALPLKRNELAAI